MLSLALEDRPPIILGDLKLLGFNLDALKDYKDILFADWGDIIFAFQTVETELSAAGEILDFKPKDVFQLLLNKNCRKISKKLSQVIRWNRFVVKAGDGDKFRQHNVLQHTYSATYFANLLAKQLGWTAEDVAWFSLAFECHDWGEGILQRDVSATDKQAHDDIAECEAVTHYFFTDGMSKQQVNRTMSAFMLQFALDGQVNGYDHQARLQMIKQFPWQAQEALASLREKQEMAQLFYFLERFGYFIYALEQYLDYDYPYILADVLHYGWLPMKSSMAKVNGLQKALFSGKKVQHLDDIYNALHS